MKLVFRRRGMKIIIAAALAALVLASGCVAAWEHGVMVQPPSEEWDSARDEYNAVGVLDFARDAEKKEMIAAKLATATEALREHEQRLKDTMQKRQFQARGAGGGEPAVTKRMIIYVAGYVISVYDLEGSSKKIVKMAEDVGGYVATQTNDTVVVRVPAAKFREVIEKLEAVGRVVDKTLQARDVTEQHTDLSLRLSAKKKYLETLQNLLDKAQDAKAMLEIQKEIGRVVEEIEAMEGKLRYLADQVSYSTITVSLHLATKRAFRTFRLPFGWIESLGIEHLVTPGGGAR
jgi:hypothetical protein